MQRKNIYILAATAPIIFIYSLFIIEPYTSGDQYHYRLFYNTIKEFSFLETIKASQIYIGASEPISILILQIGAKLGIDKDIYISMLNATLGCSLTIWLRNNKTQWLLILLFITSFYTTVLMTGAERLKIAYIFIILAGLTSGKKRTTMAILSIASHFQMLILALSVISTKLERAIKNLAQRFSISKSELKITLIAATCLVTFVFSFWDKISEKALHYAESSFGLGELIQISILTILLSIITRNKTRLLLALAPLFPIVLTIGGSRVNMIAFSVGAYLIIKEHRQNSIIFYAIMIYLSTKSIPFIIKIFETGNGFE